MIDTQNKRRSVVQYAPFTIAPVADGTIGDADREQATWLYSGLPPVVPVVSGVLILPRRFLTGIMTLR